MRVLIFVVLCLTSDAPPMRCTSDTECMEMFGGYGDPEPRTTQTKE
jgi:hypothetical protein